MTNKMGCDIHGYIEYEDWTNSNGNVHRSCFGENLGGRDYAMFGLLAGVRRDGCIYQPRGIPDGLSYTCKSAYCLFVVDDNKDEDGEGYTTREMAIKWVDGGYSKWFDDKHVTNPDYHTPSWLNIKEYETVLRAREDDKEYGAVDQEWYAILAAMKVLKNARFVFWFDN